MATVEARITSVEQDATTGWYRITTDDETIRRLDTKVPEKAREAAELKKSEALALIEFTEKQSTNINPHTNQPYMNRYYEQAGSIEVKEEPPEIPLITPTRAPISADEAWRICLSVGARLAVMTLPLMPKDQQSFEVQQRVALGWAKFLFFSQAPVDEADDIPF